VLDVCCMYVYCVKESTSLKKKGGWESERGRCVCGGEGRLGTSWSLQFDG
jgi:hypothetical protein